MAKDLHRPAEAVRITTAAASRNADIAARQKRYVLSMGFRTICFLAAVTTSLLGGPALVVGILIAAALVLPYVAVVMANAASSREDAFLLPPGQHGRPELLTGSPPKRDT